MTMSRGMKRRLLGFIALSLFAPGSAVAQEMIVYPANDQAPEQQEKDEYECHKWAKGRTGFDPMAPPPNFSPDPPVEVTPTKPARGGAVRGAARGAVGGAVIGEIADDDPGKGAAIGAGAGAVRGARRQALAQKQRQAIAQDQAREAKAEVEGKKAAYDEQRSLYNKAKRTCLQGRGYTVN